MRITSIDFLRVIAVYAVILIHTKPFMYDIFREPSYRLTEFLFNQPPRFAVPFFFVVAGYFLGKPLRDSTGVERWRKVGQYVKRLLVVMLGWSTLYTLIPCDWTRLRTMGYLELVLTKVKTIYSNPLLFLLEGGKDHLWFLPSLMMGVVLLALCTLGKRILPAVILAISLFLLGLLGGSYAITPLGLSMPFFTRDGPFLSLICLVAGFLIFMRKPTLSAKQALAITAAGISLHGVESWYLWKYFAVPWIQHNYLLGTVVAAIGVVLFALSKPEFGKKSNLHTLGQYTFGVYACHYLFVDAIGPFLYLFEPHLFQLLFPLVVFLLAVALTSLLFRFTWLKALVS